MIVGGDLNGHIGRSRDGIERIHGGWGMRDRNDVCDIPHWRKGKSDRLLDV